MKTSFLLCGAFLFLLTLFSLYGVTPLSSFAQEGPPRSSPEAQSAFDRGIDLFKKGDIAGAEEAFSQVLTLEPSHALSSYNLGLIQRRLGRLEEAEAAFRSALISQPSLLPVHLQLGQVLEAKGLFDQALEEYQTVLSEAPPNSPEAQTANTLLDLLEGRLEIQERLTRGGELFQKGDLDGAVREYLSILVFAPDSPEAFFNLGVVYMRQDRLDPAVGAFLRAIASSPRSLDAHFRLAQVYEVQRKFLSSSREYQLLLYLDPERSSPLTREAERALPQLQVRMERAREEARPSFESGIELSRAGDMAGALTAFQEAVRRDPENGLLHYNLGILYATRKEIGQAVVEMRQALQILPDYFPAHYRLGLLYESMRLFREAIREYLATLSVVPDPALPEAGGAVEGLTRAQDALARAQAAARVPLEEGRERQRKGETADALAAFRQAAALDPGDPDIQYLIGVALRELGRTGEAAASFQMAIRLRPDHARALLQLGLVQEDQGQIRDALRLFISAAISFVEKASQEGIEAVSRWRKMEARLSSEREGRRHFRRATRLFEKGRTDEAFEEFSLAATLDPSNPTYHYNLGLSLLRKNLREEAATSFGISAQLGPTLPEPHFQLGRLFDVQRKTDEARREYRLSLDLAGDRVDPEMTAIRERLRELERRFFLSLSYGFGFISNINQAQEPRDDLLSTISARATFYVSRTEKLTLPVGLTVSESLYNRAQTLSLGSTFSVSVISKLAPAYTAGGGYTFSSGLLEGLGRTSYNHSVFLEFSVRGEDLPLRRARLLPDILLHYDLLLLRSFFSKTFDTNRNTLRLTATKRVSTTSLSGYYEVVNNPVLGTDLSSLSHTGGVTVTRSLTPRLSGTLGYSYTRYFFTHPDSLARLELKRAVERENAQNVFSLSLTATLAPGLQFTTTLTHIVNDSNLRAAAPATEEEILSGQTSSLGDYQVTTVFAVLSFSL